MQGESDVQSDIPPVLWGADELGAVLVLATVLVLVGGAETGFVVAPVSEGDGLAPYKVLVIGVWP